MATTASSAPTTTSATSEMNEEPSEMVEVASRRVTELAGGREAATTTVKPKKRTKSGLARVSAARVCRTDRDHLRTLRLSICIIPQVSPFSAIA